MTETAATSTPTDDATAPEDRLAGTMLGLRCRAARQLGCRVEILDPETGCLVELARDGRRRVLVGAYSPLNDAGAARLADDKFHTGLVLARAGLTVPATARCLLPDRFQGEYRDHEGLAPAAAFADRHGLPLVVKPNRGARGRDVQLIEERAALTTAIERVWRFDYLALVQRPAAGWDLRIDLLDGELLFAYLRRPVVLTGDGSSTVGELLAAADPRYRPGGELLRRLPEDPIWRRRGSGAGWALDRVPETGAVVDLGDPILNLNRLCLADHLPRLPDGWLELARRIAREVGLRHIGVDLKVPAPERGNGGTGGEPAAEELLAGDPAAAVVLEVNASPSLAQMAARGYLEQALAAERRVVAALFG